LTVGFLQFWNDSRRRILFQEKGLPSESIEKEVVEKMEGFLGCSLLKYSYCAGKI